MPSDSLPGDPNAAQLAAADQKHAAVRAAVDRLIAAAPTRAGTEPWIHFAYRQVVDAVDDLAGDGAGGFAAAALGIAAEALLRLAATEEAKRA